MKSLLLALGIYLNLTASIIFAVESNFEDNPEKYPFIGNWFGKVTHTENPKYKKFPNLNAQVFLSSNGNYNLKLVERLYKRANPILQISTKVLDKRIVFKRKGWNIIFSKDGTAKGTFDKGKSTFELKKELFRSPTLGLKPPIGSVILFDGNDMNQWQHTDGRNPTWLVVKNQCMQTVSQKGKFKKNKKKGIGGDIVTKKGFGSMKFHMEFRYSVEPNKSGQGRGNSGLFFVDIGEIQILNSFGLEGYWNQCGAFYKKSPPLVNAAGPPLKWQSYDVEINLVGESAPYNKATVTAYLNGHKIHSEVDFKLKKFLNNIKIKLQDHINILQFRNIWLIEI